MIVQTMIQIALADAAVAALVGTDVYPRQLPDAASFPAIVMTKISGIGETDQAGAVDLEDARVQVDLYTDEGYSDVLLLRKAVRDLFHGRPHPSGANPCAIQRATCINDVDFPEPLEERAGPRLRRRMLEFRVWNTEV